VELEHDGFLPLVPAVPDRFAERDFLEPATRLHQLLQSRAAGGCDAESLLVLARHELVSGKPVQRLADRAVPDTVARAQRLGAQLLVGWERTRQDIAPQPVIDRGCERRSVAGT